MENSLYQMISNPLDNNRFIKEMLYYYVYSDNMIDEVTRNDQISDVHPSIIFHDLLYKMICIEWINKIDLLYNSMDKSDENYSEIKQLHDYLSNCNVRSFKDTFNLIGNGYKDCATLFSKYGFFSDLNYNPICINTSSEDTFDHCLAINCSVQKMHLFLFKLFEKCKKNNLDYCVEFDEKGSEMLSIKVYSNTDNLPIYLDLIKKVIEENEIEKELGPLPLVVGEISKNIGYMSGSDDFIERRVRDIKKCIERETAEWIKRTLNSNIITSTGREIPYKYYLFSKIVIDKKHSLLKQSDKYPAQEINTREFSYVLTESLINNYKNILHALIHNDYQYQFIVPFKSINVVFTYDDFKDLLKSQTEFFKDSVKYQENVKKRIKEESLSVDFDNYGIDFSSSHLLGKEEAGKKSSISLEVLNNFSSDNMRSNNNSREGRILDSNIASRKKSGILNRFRKK